MKVVRSGDRPFGTQMCRILMQLAPGPFPQLRGPPVLQGSVPVLRIPVTRSLGLPHSLLARIHVVSTGTYGFSHYRPK